MNNFLGIIGGLGPQASSLFYEMVIEFTDVNKDQDHINMIIFNHATISDRTAYILDHSKANPYNDLKNDILLLSKLGARLLIITCNTACYFLKDLQSFTNVPILNLVEDTIKYVKSKNINYVTILATTGTVKSKLYQNACEKYNIDYEILNDDLQEKLMYIIYEDIKKNNKIRKESWDYIIDNCNSSYFITGCTELSILKKKLKLDFHFIDPLEIEAKNVITFFGKKLKDIN